MHHPTSPPDHHATTTAAPEAQPWGEPAPEYCAEQAVLAACMHQPAAVDTARGLLTGTDFARPAHRVVWQALLDLRDASAPTTDPIAVEHALHRTGLLRQAGDRPYLAKLAGAAHSTAAVDYYAHLVVEAAWNRHLHTLGTWLAQQTAHHCDPAALHAEARSRLDQAQPQPADHRPQPGSGPPDRNPVSPPSATVRALPDRTAA